MSPPGYLVRELARIPPCAPIPGPEITRPDSYWRTRAARTGRIDDGMADDHDGQNGVRAVVEPCQDYGLGENPQRVAAAALQMSCESSVRVDARAPKGRQAPRGPEGAEARLQCGSGQSEWRPHCSKATRASARAAVINSWIGTDSLGPCARPASPGP